MDLITDYPYWLLNRGILQTYPSLSSNIRTGVAIMGGGISGALTAWHLCKAGFEVTLIDKRHIGMGSTAASTSLIQYEIDTPLVQLIRKIGEKNAVKSYALCVRAIGDLERICKKLPPEVGFRKRPSLQYASIIKDTPRLKEEFLARKKAGIKLQWLDKQEVLKKFGFQKNAALFSAVGAEVNAYELTHALLRNCKTNGIRIYDQTEIKEIRQLRGGVELISSDEKKIRASHLVIACGYESQKYLPDRIEKIRSTYAVISQPFASPGLWYRNSLIWETADPYLYLRTTPDNRVLIGGKDDEFSSGNKRFQALPQKAKALEKSFRQLFPHLEFRTDYIWAGAFASTKDGLPYIGQHPKRPNTSFALGFGGNGIVFSVLAAQMIRDHLLGKPDPDAGIFRFNR
jgi:glycine/D-amino acid oxidase-like deaminating enzyme